MKILYISAIESNASWGAEWFMNKAFLANGVDTITIDYRKNKHRLAGKFLKIEDDFDFLLLQRGEGFPLELLKSVQRPRFFWASELVSRRRDQDRLFQSGLFDHVFVRSVDCLEALVANGWLPREKVSILLSSFDPETYKKLPEVKKDIDVLFIGSLTERRKKILSKLKNKFNITVAKAYTDEANNLYNRSKIVLNIHAEDFPDTETRVFEVLGSGAFLISEKLSEENPFKNGTHLIESSVDGMEEKISYFLKNQNEALAIAESGRSEASRAHTFGHRAQQIVSTFRAQKNEKNRISDPIDREAVERYSRTERASYFLYMIYIPFFRMKRKLKKIFNI